MGQYDREKEARAGVGKGRGKRPAYGASRDVFVDRPLNDEQTAEMRLWRADGDNVGNTVDELLEAGCRISLKYDDYNACYAAYAFAPDDGENTGYVLVGRGGTALRALSELAYRHAIHTRGAWARGVLSGKSERDGEF
jgi:hypothetical protein